MKNQEQRVAWSDTKRVHYLSSLSESINILFSSCTFKPGTDSHASDLSLNAFSLATLDPFLPPRLTVRAPEHWNDKAELIQTVNISWSYSYRKSNLGKRWSFILQYKKQQSEGVRIKKWGKLPYTIIIHWGPHTRQGWINALTWDN